MTRKRKPLQFCKLEISIATRRKFNICTATIMLKSKAYTPASSRTQEKQRVCPSTTLPIHNHDQQSGRKRAPQNLHRISDCPIANWEIVSANHRNFVGENSKLIGRGRWRLGQSHASAKSKMPEKGTEIESTKKRRDRFADAKPKSTSVPPTIEDNPSL